MKRSRRTHHAWRWGCRMPPAFFAAPSIGPPSMGWIGLAGTGQDGAGFGAFQPKRKHAVAGEPDVGGAGVSLLCHATRTSGSWMASRRWRRCPCTVCWQHGRLTLGRPVVPALPGGPPAPAPYAGDCPPGQSVFRVGPNRTPPHKVAIFATFCWNIGHSRLPGRKKHGSPTPPRSRKRRRGPVRIPRATTGQPLPPIRLRHFDASTMAPSPTSDTGWRLDWKGNLGAYY